MLFIRDILKNQVLLINNSVSHFVFSVEKYIFSCTFKTSLLIIL